MTNANKFSRVSTVGLGEHRGRPRIYLQGRWLAQASFAAGERISVVIERGRVTVQLAAAGERLVSSKQAGAVPVIDLNTAELAKALMGAQELQVKATAGTIVITPARTALKRATRCRNGKEGSLFAGGGLMAEAARQAGYEPAFAVEWDERYAEIFSANHPAAMMFNCSISEVPLDELPEVEHMTIGIPCEPFSRKRAKGGQVPEAHELGDMVFWALRIVDHLNPYQVTIEESPNFLNSGAGQICMHALRRMGYTVDARIIDSTKYGALCPRRRAVIIATSDDVVTWPEETTTERKLGEILDPAADAWFDRSSKGWLFNHWDRQAAKGNSFGNQKFDASSSAMGSITKRYFSQQGDGPVIRHPSKADTYRWLTLDEVKRLMGLPAGYELGSSKTVAGEVIGQGVVVSTFAQIIAAAGR